MKRLLTDAGDVGPTGLGGAAHRVVLASVVTVVGTVFLIAAVTADAVKRVDGLRAENQERLLASSLKDSIDQITFDQEGVAIGDDVVENVRTTYNQSWVDRNLRRRLVGLHKHDYVALLDATNNQVYAHYKNSHRLIEHGESLDALVKDLRQRIAAGALDDYEAGRRSIPYAANRIVCHDQPAIISVMPIVPDTGAIKQLRGTEYLLVSIRYLDETFVAHQARTNALDGARFSFQNRPKSREQAFPVKNEAGGTIGYILWQPTRPGGYFLSSMLPALMLGFFAFAGLIALLIHNLLGSYRRLKEGELRARHASRHDALTGLPNRGYFEERLADSLYGPGDAPVALLFLDLDRFKQVNDTHGHPAGDMLIQTFAQRLAKLLNAEEFLARLGGDEFAIIVPGGRNVQRIDGLCEEVLAAAGAPFWIWTKQALVGASIGIAMAKKGDKPSDLTRKADIALYQAKNAGRHRSAYFSEDAVEQLASRRQLELELRAAIRTGQGLSVVFQPIFDAATRTITGAEALARWDNPRVGHVAPPVFIDIAEECGLIEPLGAWILKESCAVATATGMHSISVNTSAAQFLTPGFARTVKDILEQTGLAPDRLELELTERTLLDASEAAKETMRQLRQSGVRISLDDFGTGYSSLSYLLQHKVDRLKIDRSFISDMEAGGPAASVVLAIITMAHAMEISVVAEGVETAAQAELLQLLGCDSLQGYHLSRPVPAVQLRSLLELTAKVA